MLSEAGTGNGRDPGLLQEAGLELLEVEQHREGGDAAKALPAIEHTRYIGEIFIHCSATPPSMDISADDIRDWHLARGWSDIGYHAVIKRDGTIEAGRSEDRAGAHDEWWLLRAPRLDART